MNKALEPKVSVIICAYNEEKYIAQTLRDLLKCKTAQEIIVVNDGSKDKTKNIIDEIGDKVVSISYKLNRGKGYAFALGVKAATGNIIVMLDADLKGLKDKHLKSLVLPIVKKESTHVLAYPKKGGIPILLTGQRAYLKELLLPYLDLFKKTRYGLETYLNDIYKTRWGKIVRLNDLSFYSKFDKFSKNEAINSYLQEIIEISKTKAEIQASKYRYLNEILKSKEIKNLKQFRKKLLSIKDKDVVELIERYILPLWK